MAESTMEEVINVEGELHPCEICGRTFLPVPLTKHMRVCERNATRKRKVFDSLKQRVEGTELAPFHQRTYLKKHNTPTAPEPNRQSNKWREKHLELVNTIRAARGLPTEMPSKRTNTAAGGERCPSCDRQFGPRAFDRHVEWCKEHKARIQKSPAGVLLAKERLEARTKYRVPLPNKSKRSLIRDKYSPIATSKTESINNLKSLSTSNLERTPSIRKPKSVQNVKKVNEKVLHEHNDEVALEIQSKCEETNVKHHAKQKEKSVPKETKTTHAMTNPAKSDKQSDYNPFVTAERQLMELLECDDFKPFFSKPVQQTQQRPHTTTNTNLKPIATSKNNNKVVKSAESARKKLNLKSDPNSKRTSVIDPPMDFQDKLNLLSDDFELIESLINQNYIDGYDFTNDLNDISFDNISSKISKNYFVESDANENVKERKYSDDMSSIDPRLINENDNLSIPENLKNDDYSSHSSNDNLMPLISNISKKTRPKRTLEKMSQSLDEPASVANKNTKQINQNKKPIRSTKQTGDVHKSTASLTSSCGATRNQLSTDKKKNLSTLKRSVSLVDPIKPKNTKNKDMQNYFNQQQEKKNTVTVERISPERQIPKNQKSEINNIFTASTAEELFSVDDEMYEEYKKYEEMYLREKQQQMQSEKKQEEFISSGTLTPNDGSDNVAPNIKVSGDSAYSSLNRKAPKVRARSTKLAPLDRQRSQTSPVGSPTSSGSDTSPSFFKQLSAMQRMSKFCHECGNKYPINTAKFCVECGIKRLVL